MDYAVDKEGIVRALLRGEGACCPAPMGPATEGYDPSIKVMYDYGPRKGRAG